MRLSGRVVLRLTVLISLLFVGLAILLCWFPFIAESAKRAWIKRWSNWVVAIIGLRITQQGSFTESPSALVVANHSSWLDIVVINSLQPAAFIAKAEIARWPVVGLLVARSGTLFIERGKRHAVHAVLKATIERLKQSSYVVVFPEGTTNNGHQLLPFHGNLVEAAIRAGVPVQPLAISYRNSSGAIADSVAFIGDMTFADSMLTVLGDSDINVVVRSLPAMDTYEKTRHELAEQARNNIAAELGF